MPFTDLTTARVRALFPGVTGRYTHAARITTGEIDLEAGSTVPLHQHPHDQLSYVISGRLEFTVGPEVQILEPGNCAIIPGGILHGCRAITACRVLDTFTPIREDYR
jgi:quercetin dioxygenase-like cupin family protein